MLSHQRAVKAQEEGIFKKEIVPVVVPGKDRAIEQDNGPREDRAMEKLGKLRVPLTKNTAQ